MNLAEVCFGSTPALRPPPGDSSWPFGPEQQAELRALAASRSAEDAQAIRGGFLGALPKPAPTEQQARIATRIRALGPGYSYLADMALGPGADLSEVLDLVDRRQVQDGQILKLELKLIRLKRQALAQQRIQLGKIITHNAIRATRRAAHTPRRKRRASAARTATRAGQPEPPPAPPDLTLASAGGST